jgi:hypothetical protein
MRVDWIKWAIRQMSGNAMWDALKFLAGWLDWRSLLVGFAGFVVSAWFAFVRNFPLAYIVLGAFFGALIALLMGNAALYYWYARRGNSFSVAPSKLAETDAFTLRQQEALAKRLREIGTGTVHLQFASMPQLELMQKLESIFELAGWRTNPANVPLERSTNQYFKGVLVKGYNRLLVESVAEELKRSDIQNVMTEIEPLALTRENPKWDGAQRTVRITVGH